MDLLNRIKDTGASIKQAVKATIAGTSKTHRVYDDLERQVLDALMDKAIQIDKGKPDAFVPFVKLAIIEHEIDHKTIELMIEKYPFLFEITMVEYFKATKNTALIASINADLDGTEDEFDLEKMYRDHITTKNVIPTYLMLDALLNNASLIIAEWERLNAITGGTPKFKRNPLSSAIDYALNGGVK